MNNKTRISSIWLISTLLLAPFARGQDADTSMPSIPDHFQQGGVSRDSGYENQNVNEVIDTFTGKLQYHFTDLVIPGAGGMDLVIQRSYNSVDDPNETPSSSYYGQEFSPLGQGWSLHMGRVIRGAIRDICSSGWEKPDANPVLETPDGARQVLYEQTPTSAMWITKNFWRARCIGGSLHVQSPDGTTYEMTVPGHSFGPPVGTQNTYYAGRIVDRNGNTFNLTYGYLPNGVQAIRRIVTSDGRAVSFAYSGSYLSSITDDTTGRVWRYTVVDGPAAGRGQLTAVERPDGQFWRHSYHDASPGLGSMRRIEYPSGGSIDYTYKHVNFRAGYVNSWPSTVISSKQVQTNTADGALGAQSGVWTWDYEVASEVLTHTVDNDGTAWYEYQVPPPVRSQVNVTRVTDPLQQQVEHYYMGLMSVHASVKLTGTYLGRASPEENELFGYADIGISTQQEINGARFGLPSGSGDGVYARVKSRQWRGRAGQANSVVWSGFDAWGNAGQMVETGEVHDGRTHTRTTSTTFAPDTSRWLLRLATGKTVTLAAEGEQPAETYSVVNGYDDKGNLTSQTRAGVTTGHTYTAQGDLASTTDALGRTTTYSGHFRGIARTEQQPEGVSVSRQVDDAGNVVSLTNGRGMTSAYTFDGLNRVTQITPPAGAPVNVAYGARTRTVTRGAMVDELTMDGLGRPRQRRVSASGMDSISVDFEHDILGRRVFTSYPNRTSGIGHAFDALGRPIRTYHNASPDLTTHDALETTRYDSMSTLHVDANGHARYVKHRSFGDPQEQETIDSMQGALADGLIFPALRAKVRRNVMGQPTLVEMGGVVREMKYDSRYYLESSTEPETGLTIYGRDAVGNMTSRSTGGLPAVNYTYDGRNRVRVVSHPDSENPLVPRAPEVVLTYDETDLVRTVVAGPVSRGYTYNENGKLIAESLELDGRTYNLAYSYDANEALASMTYPSGRTIEFRPDAYGRARAAAPYVTSVDYHPSGLPDAVTYANGVVSTMGLGARQWPQSLRVLRSGSALVDSSLEYDLMGNLSTINDAVDGSFSRQFEYDSVDRLKSETIGGFSTTAYLYDQQGNLTYMEPPIGGLEVGTPFPYSYAYDATSRRLASVSRQDGVNRTYSYDTAGNVIADGVNQFGYDRANQLRCVACGSGSETRYSYDGKSMRVKTEAAGKTSYALYGQNGLLMMTETPGVERREYIYLGRRQVAEHRVRLD